MTSSTYTYRIAMVVKGDYDTTTSYVPLDVVYYNNNSYVCKANTSGTFDSSKWQMLIGDIFSSNVTIECGTSNQF